MKLEEIDKNLKVETKIDKPSIKFYNAQADPFRIYGVFFEEGAFRRMPKNVAEPISKGIAYLHLNTAGGRVRFRTDSPYVAIRAKMNEVLSHNNMSLTGSAGFDVYINDGDGEIYARTLRPPIGMKDGYESLAMLDSAKMRDITINLPLYSNVNELYIGIDENSKLEAPTPYINKKPIVFYGSSITQGCSASRPGMCYQAFISRRFNCDYINLGFSGNAKAEEGMYEYIKELDMSVFVYDYDYNCTSPEHLETTHEKMFKAIRGKYPTLPIIIMTAPKWVLTEEFKKRHDIIEKTFTNAVMAGDRNVYFLDGAKLMKLCQNDGTVDNCHPNDFGFASMAEAIGNVIAKIWEDDKTVEEVKSQEGIL